MTRLSKSLSTRPWSEEGFYERLNRELIPAMLELQRVVSERFGDTKDVSSDYQVSLADEFLLVDASGGSLTVTLPEPEDFFREVIVKKVDATGNSVAVVPNDSETIDGGLFSSLTSQWDSVRLRQDDGDWFVV